MLRFLSIFLVTAFFFTISSSFAQDFSNKGKEFWLCFPSHVPSGANQGKMGLFITSDKNSSGIITVNGFSTSFSVTANQITGPINIPYSNAHINSTESGTVVNKGIHIAVDNGKPPVVVYSHIYAAARSAASLILPVSALGRKYQSTNYIQKSASPDMKSQFVIIATEPNTTVQYQLRRNGVLDPIINTKILNNPGEVLQIQDANDLTGSFIESIAGADGSCKKIAVFSGSSSLAINSASCNGASYDPLFQQAYPINTWGKNFGVINFERNPNGYHLRVQAAEDGTIVNIGGNNITLNKGEFYPGGLNPNPFTTPISISSNKPVSVAQYMVSAACNGSPISGEGDPDMVILNPIEQNINDISIFSSSLEVITRKYISVYIPTRFASSFKINGNIPNAPFQSMVPANGYSYLIENLTNYAGNSFRLTADSGFNAIAYGLGSVETYSYSAGTNVKDLYQFVNIRNEFATVDFPATCKGAPFTFSMVFPYEPTEIAWKFEGLFNDVTINAPVYDSTWIVNGKRLYRYKLPNSYSHNIPGTYPIKVIAQNPTPDGCSGTQEITFELKVFDRPKADFKFTSTGCLADTVRFFDSTNVDGRGIIKWNWNFGDNKTGNIKNPLHAYQKADAPFNVTFSLVTDIGCVSDTITQAVTLAYNPKADFEIPGQYCANKKIVLKNTSTNASSTIVKWTWDFGDGSAPVVGTSGVDQDHIYATTGNFITKLQVETSNGCKSNIKTKNIKVNATPVLDFNISRVCLPHPVKYTPSASISDGTEAQITYEWDFGDGNTSIVKEPTHLYHTIGPFNVKLTAISNTGCTKDTTKIVADVYPEPQALFKAPDKICIGDTIQFEDKSSADKSTVTKWQWNFDDGTFSTDQNPNKKFVAPGEYEVKLTITSAVGCISSIYFKKIYVNELPVANFKFEAPFAICEKRGITFTDLSTSKDGTIINSKWDMGDGTIYNKSDNLPFTHTYAKSGKYDVRLVIESNEGCTSIVKMKVVEVNPLPNVGFILPENCIADAFSQFTDTSKIEDGTESFFKYEWSFGDHKASATNPNTSILKNPRHSYTEAKIYNVKLKVTSGAGCSMDLTKSLSINGSVPVSLFEIKDGISHCSNNEISIINKSSADVGDIVKLEIFWDASDPTSKEIDNEPFIGKVYKHKYPSFYTPSKKNYTIKVVAYSGESCLEESSSTIEVKVIPEIVFNKLAPVCLNIPAYTITNASVVNGLMGASYYTGPGITRSGLFTPSIAGVGSHNLQYTYTADNGCSNIADEIIQVYDLPKVNAGPDLLVLEGSSITINGSATGNGNIYKWTPDNSFLNNYNIIAPLASPKENTTYTFTVTSAEGCKVSDNVFVKVLRIPRIPNAFSPNGDGIHDKWEVAHLATYPGATVEIYNRYGQLVFKSVGYDKPWDGTSNGKPLPIGTYYYLINPKNGRGQISGFVDLIR